eukprot:1114344-Pleurochrysis_carterae.AAC.1
MEGWAAVDDRRVFFEAGGGCTWAKQSLEEHWLGCLASRRVGLARAAQVARRTARKRHRWRSVFWQSSQRSAKSRGRDT